MPWISFNKLSTNMWDQKESNLLPPTRAGYAIYSRARTVAHYSQKTGQHCYMLNRQLSPVPDLTPVSPLRKVRDSNPRSAYALNRFQDGRLQPDSANFPFFEGAAGIEPAYKLLQSST